MDEIPKLIEDQFNRPLSVHWTTKP